MERGKMSKPKNFGEFVKKWANGIDEELFDDIAALLQREIKDKDKNKLRQWYIDWYGMMCEEDADEQYKGELGKLLFIKDKILKELGEGIL